MGDMVPFTNTSKTVKHIGNTAVHPNSTRMVDETLLPAFKAEKPTEAEPDKEALMVELLDHSVKELPGIMAALSLEELDLAEQVETANQNRKGALEAIAEERLSRAKAAQEAAEFAAMLAEMGDSELQEQADLAHGDEGLRALVEAELEKRQHAQDPNG